EFSTSTLSQIKGHRHLLPRLARRLRIKGVTQPIADDIQAQHRDENEQARNNRQMRACIEELVGVTEHVTPCGNGWLYAQAKITQRGLRDDQSPDSACQHH